jgi:hypothetical protein
MNLLQHERKNKKCVHTYILDRYFVEQQHKREIERENSKYVIYAE